MFSRLLASRSRASSSVRSLLLCMGLLDEIIAGFPVVALPLLRDRLHLSYAQVGLLFMLGALSGLVFEPLINLFSDRFPKKLWILSGLLLLAVSDIVLGTTTSYALAIAAFIVSAPAGEAAIGLSQAVVIDAAPAESVRTMTRWTLLSSIGDFLAPLFVAGFGFLQLGWSALCWFAAALWLCAATLLSRARFPIIVPAFEHEGKTATVWTNLRAALRDPLLLHWSALALILTLQMLAGFLGLFAFERWVLPRHLAPTLLLTWLSLATLLGVLGLLFAHALWLVIVSLLVINLNCVNWYPLAKAEAYARRPGSSGLVRTVIGLGQPFEMVLPGAVGLISASFGVLAGLGALGLAPLLMLLLLPTRRLR